MRAFNIREEGGGATSQLQRVQEAYQATRIEKPLKRVATHHAEKRKRRPQYQSLDPSNNINIRMHTSSNPFDNDGQGEEDVVITQ